MTDRRARTTDEVILSEIADLLIEQNALLRDAVDRLAPPVAAGPPAEVHEPVPAEPSQANQGDGGEGGVDPVLVTEPAPPPRPGKKLAAKTSPAAAKRTTVKKET